MSENNTWLNHDEVTPENGKTYLCRISRNGVVIESKKIYRGGIWFGGCRPFCENDIILSYKKEG